MWCMLVTGLLVAAVDVDVQSISGDEVSGQLVSISESGLIVETIDGRKTVNLADLLTVRPKPASPVSPPADAVRVLLMDGTMILARGYAVSDRMAAIELDGAARLEVPTRAIQWVRFRAPDAKVDDQWRMITQQEAAGDVVAIRKSPAALDQLEGVLHDIADQKATFEFDGDKIPVNLKKLEGIVYFHPLRAKKTRPMCKVTTGDGSTWNAKSLTLADGILRVITSSGVDSQIPLERVQMLDFSSGNVIYLSDTEPVSSTWTPFLESPLLAAKLQQLYGPKRDRTFDGRPLKLGDRVYRKGLALHSRSELVYRLTESFRRLQADVGIDASLRNAGHVELVIFGDDKELYREAISGRDDPRTLDLDISGIRRLRILVDFGERLDIADHLHLCNLRIIK